MKIKLKDAVIFKDVNEDCMYAVDCLAEGDSFYKFEGPAKFFIEQLKEGKSESEILILTLSQFTDCEEAQVKNDWDKFVQTITSYGFIQN